MTNCETEREEPPAVALPEQLALLTTLLPPISRVRRGRSAHARSVVLECCFGK